MQSVDYIICSDYILTMNTNMDVIKNGAIAIKDRIIFDVDIKDNILAKYSSKNIINSNDTVAMPGFINTHTHAAMVYFRGLADDIPLKEWLEKHIWPAENRWLSPQFVSDAVELACLEMLKAGITCFCDMYFFQESAAHIAKRIGIRAVLGPGIVDFPTASAKNTDEYLSNSQSFIEEWKDDELISPCVAPHAPYTCSPETLKRAKKVSERFGVPIHIHLSETEWEVKEIVSRYGKRPVEHLDNIGFLDKDVFAAHCVWVNNKEIDILSRHGVGVSHCIESNLKLASGIAPIVKMLKSGIKVSLGTDGAASNNDINIISEMSTAAKVHKAIANDPTVLDSKTVTLMATRWAADVLGLGDKIGSIEKGKLADIIIMNIKKPHLTPIYDIYSHIVYAATASDIETVFINGIIVINNRSLVTADEEEILNKAKNWAEKIIQFNKKQ